ncbi:unnamed protein product [Coffea canephora]|uniref:F-box domain-containing protein n=1 Tax=Coffea canephora TaxID=49390 RepID=A0A068U1I3_COFCA|nr:unnamed protein product [Coffea canephora]
MNKYIPLHLITEILLKLPVKSLLKFKCTLKSWLSVISSRQFIKSHLENHAWLNNRRLLMLDDYETLKTLLSQLLSGRIG